MGRRPAWILKFGFEMRLTILRKHCAFVSTDRRNCPVSGDGHPSRKPPRIQDRSTYLHVPEAPGPVDDKEFLHEVSVWGKGEEKALAA